MDKEKIEEELDRLQFFLLELENEVKKARIQVLNILGEVKNE